MLIQLNQQEIEESLTKYLEVNGFNLKFKEVTISFSQRRQPTSEFIADVEIKPISTETKPATPAKRGRGRPPKIKTESVEEVVEEKNELEFASTLAEETDTVDSEDNSDSDNEKEKDSDGKVSLFG